MANTILLVKNMVCRRCVLAVEDILKKTYIPFQKVVYGEIHLKNDITTAQKELLKYRLENIGFELINTRISRLIEKIKMLVIKRARNEAGENDSQIKLSVYLKGLLHHEYTYLSNLFSQVEGRTIENFFIEQRIEKAKELIVYAELTLSQIAFELDYSSVAHLSNQFKKITGLTPTYFKKVGTARRKSLDTI